MSGRSSEQKGAGETTHGLPGIAKRNLKLLLPMVVLLVGMALAGGMVIARPGVSTQQSPKLTPLVRVLSVEPESTRLRIRSQGSVSPRTESDLIAEVSGRVTWVSPSLAVGGFVAAGELLIRIDARDYEVALSRSKAALARAESQLALADRASARLGELASRGVASPVALDDAENAALVAGANRLEADAVLTQARHDLERTRIAAPFEGLVRVKHIGLGQFVNRGTPLARIYAVDYAEVRLPIPDDDAAHVDLPIAARGGIGEQAQPEVTLTAEFGGQQHRWTGRIVRTEGELDPRTRMIHAVARIEDPYSLGEPPVPGEETHDAGEGARDGGSSGRPPLAVGLFVDAEILGREIDGVYSLPASALRGSDQVVVIDADNRAYRRRVKLLQRLQDRVLIASGIEAGDRVVTTPLALTVDGMLVEVSESVASETAR